MPTYYAGETIEVTFVFEYGEGIRSVTAIFVNESNPNRIIQLTGDAPSEKATAAGGLTYWQTVLSGNVAASDALGVYRCVFIQAEYEDGIRADFTRIPDNDRFGIERKSVPPPSGISWVWDKRTSEE